MHNTESASSPVQIDINTNLSTLSPKDIVRWMRENEDDHEKNPIWHQISTAIPLITLLAKQHIRFDLDTTPMKLMEHLKNFLPPDLKEIYDSVD